jgi:uncharacterized protein YciI
MAGEIPEGLAIEQIWVVEAALGPDAAERRAAVRSEHLARLARLRDAGTVVQAGAFAAMSASLLLLRVPSEEAALALARADVYYRAGVWTGFRIRALGRVIRTKEPAAG